MSRKGWIALVIGGLALAGLLIAIFWTGADDAGAGDSGRGPKVRSTGAPEGLPGDPRDRASVPSPIVRTKAAQLATGTVLDEGRSPVGRASLRRGEAKAASDAAGVFEIEMLAGGHSLIVTADGFVPAEVPVGDDVREVGDIILVRADWAIEGTVVDPAGAGVGGILVRAQTNSAAGPRGMEAIYEALATGQRPPRLVSFATTDPSGRFRIAIARQVAAVQLVARTEHATGFKTVRSLGSGLTVQATIVLSPTYVVRGRVTEESGQPVEGVRVSAMPNAERHDAELTHLTFLCQATRTAADGTYTLHGVPAAPLLVTATRAGSSTTVREAHPPFSEPVDFVLPGSKAEVRGVVRDATTRKPIAGASIEALVQAGDAARSATAKTDTEGRFALSGIAGSSLVQLSVRHDGYAPASNLTGEGVPEDLASIVASTTGGEPVEILLHPALKLRGRVVLSDKRPAPEARVNVNGVGGLVAEEVITDAEGRFEVAGFAEGRCMVDVTFANWALPEDQRFIDIDSSSAEKEHVLLLTASKRLKGRVVTGAREPVSGAEVNVTAIGSIGVPGRTITAVTDASGDFTIAGVVPGAMIEIMVDDPRFMRFQREQATSQEVAEVESLGDLELTAGAIVRGQVVNASKRPVSGTRIVLAAGQDDFLGGTTCAMSDSGGVFEFRRVPPGTAHFLATSPEYRAQQVVVKDLAAGEVRVGLVIELEAGRVVQGKVVTTDGVPLAGALVKTFWADEKITANSVHLAKMMTSPFLMRFGVTRGDGAFRLAGVIGDRAVQVIVAASGYQTHTQWLDSKETSDLSVTLRRVE